MSALRKLVKNTITKIRTFDDNRDRNQTAYSLLRVIEKEKGKLNLSDKKLCKEYAQDVLGNKVYTPWLYVYSAFSGEFKEGWIPDNYYSHCVIPNVSGSYGGILERNAITDKLLNISNSLDICYYINNFFYGINNDVLNEGNIKRILFKEKEKVVFKTEDSQQGAGIHFFDSNSFTVEAIRKLGNGVFQNYITQHPFFSNFTKSSVATIRITSVCDNIGNISIRAGWLKFARGNDTHCMGDATMKIPYDINSGKLYNDAYYGNWKSTKTLPDNDFAFADLALPAFDNCITEVKRMHSNFPFARCLGWDLIVDNNNNVVFIEVNGGHNGIRFTEAVQGPCFKGLEWENLHNLNKY